MKINADLNIEGFKIGATLTTFRIKNGEISYSNLIKIASWDERFGCWRSERNMAIPADGKGYYAMYSKKVDPHFYYTANPSHIKATKKAIKESKKRREKKEREDNLRFAEFEKKLDDLLSEYSAEIGAEQLSGDDQGVEVGWYISLGKNNKSMQ